TPAGRVVEVVVMFAVPPPAAPGTMSSSVNEPGSGWFGRAVRLNVPAVTMAAGGMPLVAVTGLSFAAGSPFSAAHAVRVDTRAARARWEAKRAVFMGDST